MSDESQVFERLMQDIEGAAPEPLTAEELDNAIRHGYAGLTGSHSTVGRGGRLRGSSGGCRGRRGRFGDSLGLGIGLGRRVDRCRGRLNRCIVDLNFPIFCRLDLLLGLLRGPWLWRRVLCQFFYFLNRLILSNDNRGFKHNAVCVLWRVL